MKIKWKCPVCSKKTISNILTATHTHGREIISGREKFKYFQCATCGSVYLQSVKIDSQYYEKYYDFGEAVKKRGIVTYIEKILTWSSQKRKQQTLQVYKKKENEKISILDVGCGTGDFLYNLDKQKYETFGVELNNKEYNISKSKGLTIYNEDILKKDFRGKKFDLITLWHVFEHIPDPGLLLRKLRSILSDEGAIIIATPNIESKGFAIAKTDWFHFDAPRHVILFSQRGVRTVCESNKLSVQKVFCETFEFPLDLFWSIKKTNLKANLIALLFYPFTKIWAKETLTYIIKKQ